MSQIAEGFLIPDRSIREAAACIGRGDTRAMRSILVRHAFEAFAWSGYVLVIVTEWLREQGIELPRSATASVRGIVDKCDPFLCADKQDCQTLTLRLDGVSPSAEELVRYWSAFTGDNSAEALQFMPDAWNWLNRLVRSGAGADWCLLLEG
jgi:hypothetical protein